MNLKVKKQVGRLLSVFTYPHAQMLRAVADEKPQEILLIPALLRVRKLGHAIASDGPIVQILLASSPTARVTVITDHPELWSPCNGRVRAVGRESFTKPFSTPLSTARGQIADWIKAHTVDTVVNLADETDERVFDNVVERYVSLTGRSHAADVRAPRRFISRFRYTLASGLLPLIHRAAFADGLIQEVTGQPAANWRQQLFLAPDDGPTPEMQQFQTPNSPTLLLNLYGSRARRSWHHLDSARAFLHRVLTETDSRIILAPAIRPLEREHSAALYGSLPTTLRPRVATPDDPSLKTFKRLIRMSDHVISVDTGAAHLAQALGRSPIVLSQFFATVGHPILSWHPEPDRARRHERSVFGLLPSRFNPDAVFRRYQSAIERWAAAQSEGSRRH